MGLGREVSPLLFNVYINDLSVSLSKLPIGCCIGENVMNHLMYADDIVLLSPTAKGMQRLLDNAIRGPFHGKSSQVDKNKLSNSAMKTSSYYFCIAYLICGEKIESTIKHCLVLAYFMHHPLHS